TLHCQSFLPVTFPVRLAVALAGGSQSEVSRKAVSELERISTARRIGFCASCRPQLIFNPDESKCFGWRIS
ncbi:MAG: hypothetical protein JXR03_21660, partial [Cyclobacteriaceae bacterium]